MRNWNKYELEVDGRKGVNFAKFRKETAFVGWVIVCKHADVLLVKYS